MAFGDEPEHIDILHLFVHLLLLGPEITDAIFGGDVLEGVFEKEEGLPCGNRHGLAIYGGLEGVSTFEGVEALKGGASQVELIARKVELELGRGGHILRSGLYPAIELKGVAP